MTAVSYDEVEGSCVALASELEMDRRSLRLSSGVGPIAVEDCPVYGANPGATTCCRVRCLQDGGNVVHRP